MSTPQPRRAAGVSTLFLYLVVSVLLFTMSLLALYQGTALYSSGQIDDAMIWLSSGAVGMGLSFLMTVRLRRGITPPPAIPFQNVVTIVECSKDAFKSLRKFSQGDFIFKKAEKCPKCGKPMTITSVYYEEAEKKPHPFKWLK